MDTARLGSGAAGSASITSDAYRAGYGITYRIGSVFRPVLRVPLIGTPVYLAIGLAVIVALLPVGVAIGIWYWLKNPTGRAAADPDKETVPPGWNDPRTVETAVIERKPPAICNRCGKPIPDGETVWMNRATNTVYHIRCHDLRRTMRA